MVEWTRPPRYPPSASSDSEDDFRKKSFEQTDRPAISISSQRNDFLVRQYRSWSNSAAQFTQGRACLSRKMRAPAIFLVIFFAVFLSARIHAGWQHRGWDGRRKPEGIKVVGLVFFGRHERAEILNCYLERNLVVNGGYLDEVQIVINTATEEDLKWLDEVMLPTSKSYVKVIPPDHKDGESNYKQIWSTVESGIMYVKIDDDVVYIHDDAIPELVHQKLAHPEAFVVAANTINSPLMTWVHYRQGAIHPFLPDLEPPPVPDDQNASSALMMPWRPSLLPSWTGPAGYTLAHNATPLTEEAKDLNSPRPPQRWLPLRPSRPTKPYLTDPLRRTPIFASEYNSHGTSWTSWSIAAQAHYSLFQNLEPPPPPPSWLPPSPQTKARADNLHLYSTPSGTWDSSSSRLSINVIALWGDDILPHLPLNDDEPDITLRLPGELRRSALVATRALVSHYSFFTQSGLDGTDVLQRYRSLAAEKACLAKGRLGGWVGR